MTLPSYSFRQHAFASEACVDLQPEGIQVSRQGQPRALLSWAKIGRVRLSYEPSRYQDSLYLCRIYAKGHSRPFVAISSTSYRSILNFEENLPAYRALVLDLHKRLLAQNTGIAFQAGVSRFSFWANAILVTVTAISFAVFLLTIGQEVTWGWLAWTKLAVAMSLVPLTWAWFKANRPRPYDPHAIPPELLPATENANPGELMGSP
ncbi:MAG: hypothetical protein ABL973_16865 [Micropepsaceae bacterium]